MGDGVKTEHESIELPWEYSSYILLASLGLAFPIFLYELALIHLDNPLGLFLATLLLISGVGGPLQIAYFSMKLHQGILPNTLARVINVPKSAYTPQKKIHWYLTGMILSMTGFSSLFLTNYLPYTTTVGLLGFVFIIVAFTGFTLVLAPQRFGDRPTKTTP